MADIMRQQLTARSRAHRRLRVGGDHWPVARPDLMAGYYMHAEQAGDPAAALEWPVRGMLHGTYP